MFQLYKNNVVTQQMEQCEKENHIANMLVNTLYSNDVDKNECQRIIELFKEKVLENTY